MSDETPAETPPPTAEPPADGSATNAADRRDARDRLAIPLAVLLAGLGLLGALIAWRVGSASEDAADATQAGLIAARALTREETTAVGLASRTLDAWLEYERNRRRAERLREEGYPTEGLNYAMQSASHWFLVRPEYIDEEGNYDPQAHQESYLTEIAGQIDLDADTHFAQAEAEEGRVRALLLIGVFVASALPLLTFAQFARGRLRFAATGVGATIFLIGVVLTALAWL